MFRPEEVRGGLPAAAVGPVARPALPIVVLDPDA